MTDRELMQQALEALQKIYIAPEHEEYIRVWWPACEDAITALRERLEQPEQEQKRQHDYRTRYDRGCYKCGSHYCPANCPIPAHLVRQQPEQDTVLAEREACAQLCEELDAMNWSDFGEYSSGYADEIRARGKK